MEKRRIILYCVIAILLAGNIFQFAWNNTSLSVDAVPDEETALKIAEAVLVAAYGDEVLLESSVYVRLDKSETVWIVSGYPPPLTLDGGFDILIRKSDGKILDLDLGFGKIRWYENLYYDTYYGINRDIWSLKYRWGI